MRPSVDFTICDGIDIAYQITGSGPVDIVDVAGWVSNLDLAWDYPPYARLLNRIGTFSRLIRFDKRGTGLSERNVGFPTLEQRMEDVRAVMDAAGSEKATLLGVSEGGSMSMLFAATYPERVSGLVLYGCFAKGVRGPGYPWAVSREDLDRQLESIRQAWGKPFDLSSGAPSLVGDKDAENWISYYLRNAADRRSAIGIWDWNAEIDVRDILSTIQVPTLVIHRTGDRWQPVEEGRYLAEHIPNAKYVELPGDDHVMFAGDSDAVVDEIAAFVTGERPTAVVERVLMTVMFTDIVGSTALLSKIGDSEWSKLLGFHDQVTQEEIARHGGRLSGTTGDGSLAAFDGPTAAIRCAKSIGRRLGEGHGELKIRASVHTGECHRQGKELSGVAVHLGARLLDHAGAGEIAASRTVRDLTVGSAFKFTGLGSFELKGIPGEWEIFKVA